MCLAFRRWWVRILSGAIILFYLKICEALALDLVLRIWLYTERRSATLFTPCHSQGPKECPWQVSCRLVQNWTLEEFIQTYTHARTDRPLFIIYTWLSRHFMPLQASPVGLLVALLSWALRSHSWSLSFLRHLAGLLARVCTHGNYSKNNCISNQRVLFWNALISPPYLPQSIVIPHPGT